MEEREIIGSRAEEESEVHMEGGQKASETGVPMEKKKYGEREKKESNAKKNTNEKEIEEMEQRRIEAGEAASERKHENNSRKIMPGAGGKKTRLPETQEKRPQGWFAVGSFRRLCMVGISYLLALIFLCGAFFITAYSYWFSGETAGSYEETERFGQKLRSRMKKAAPALRQYLQIEENEEMSSKTDMVKIYELQPEYSSPQQLEQGKTYTFEEGADLLNISTDPEDVIWDGWYSKKEDRFHFPWGRDTYFTRQWESEYWEDSDSGIQRYVAVAEEPLKMWMLENGSDMAIEGVPSDTCFIECQYNKKDGESNLLGYSEKKDLWYFCKSGQKRKKFAMPSRVYFPLQFVLEKETDTQKGGKKQNAVKKEDSGKFRRVNLYLDTTRGYNGLYFADNEKSGSMGELLENIPFFTLKTILYEAGKTYYTQKSLLRYIHQRMDGYLWKFTFYQAGQKGTVLEISTDKELPEGEDWKWNYQVAYRNGEEKNAAEPLSGIGAEFGYTMASAKFSYPEFSMQTLLFHTQNPDMRQRLRYELEKTVFENGSRNGIRWMVVSVLCAILWMYLMIRLLFTGWKREAQAFGGTSEDGSQLSVFDRLPTEISLGILALAALGCFCWLEMTIETIEWEYEISVSIKCLLLGLGATAAYFLCYAGTASFLRRIRSGVLWKRSLLVKGMAWWIRKLKACFRAGKGFWEEWLAGSDAKRRTVLLTAGYLLASIVSGGAAGICFLLFIAMWEGGEFLMLCLPMFCLFVWIQSRAVRYVLRNEKGKERILSELLEISEGNLSSDISETGLSGSYLQMAQTLPKVRDGMQKAIEKSIRDERMKTELITNVSHDIKTPLTSIINYIDLLKRTNPQGEQAAHYLEVLTQKSGRLKQLIDDLVEASKASSGALALEKTKLDLTELMEQAAGEFKEKLQRKKLELLLQYPEPPVTVVADGRRMYRILENLLQNVFKYALEGTRVYFDLAVVSAGEDAGLAVMTLRNISAARLPVSGEELTERFVRGEESRTTEGSGLGLSIAGDLAKLQGGSFSVQIDGDLFKAILEFPVVEAAKLQM